MFTIGEFSRFAQVTTDQLRYYDRLDLFKPMHVDKFTGYRYYKVEQLGDLNRILALKDLGLSLEQIRQLLHDHVTIDEIRGMLMLQKLKAQEAIRDEITRLQRIESRLGYLDDNGDMPQYEVVTKPALESNWVSISRRIYPELSGEAFFFSVFNAFSRLLPAHNERCVCAINAPELETDDWAMGFVVNKDVPKSLVLMNDHMMTFGTLPAYDLVASVLYTGTMQGFHRAYNALGHWIQEQDYQFLGMTYEYFYGLMPNYPQQDITAEIQMPIKVVV